LTVTGEMGVLVDEQMYIKEKFATINICSYCRILHLTLYFVSRNFLTEANFSNFVQLYTKLYYYRKCQINVFSRHIS
jgi:hypothetical protein